MHAAWQQFLIQSELDPSRLSHLPAQIPPTYCAALTTTAVLKLQGPDACQFMQGYFTADLDALDEDHSRFGAYCDIKGRVVADLLIVGLPDGLLLLTEESLAQTVRESLTKYLVFSKSEFVDVADAWLALGLMGTDAGGDVTAAPPWTVRGWPGSDARAGYQVAIPGGTRWLGITTATAAAELWQTYVSDRAEGGGVDAAGGALPWWQADVEAGIAHLHAATSGAFLPQMLGYDDLEAISFTKGCYLGQEVVTRAQHRGRVKRRLGQWAFGPDVVSTAEPGSQLTDTDGRRAGIVIQATDTHLLGVVGTDHVNQPLISRAGPISPV